MQREFTSYYQARCFFETLDHAWLLVQGNWKSPTYLVTNSEDLVDKLRGSRYISQCKNDNSLYDETFTLSVS